MFFVFSFSVKSMPIIIYLILKTNIFNFKYKYTLIGNLYKVHVKKNINYIKYFFYSFNIFL